MFILDLIKTNVTSSEKRNAVDLVKAFKEAIASRKKIRLDVEKDGTPKVFNAIDVIIKMIEFLNSFSSDEESLPDGTRIDDFQIPVEFKDFILPKSVRFVAGNKTFTDLLDRQVELENVKSFANCWTSKLLEYNMAVAELRSITKESEVDRLVTVGSVRVDKSLSDVIDCAFTTSEHHEEILIGVNAEGCIPVKLVNDVIDLDALYRIKMRYVSAIESVQVYLSNLPR